MTSFVCGLETLFIGRRVDALVYMGKVWQIRSIETSHCSRARLTVISVDKERSFGVVLFQSIDDVGVPGVGSIVYQQNAGQGPV